ncbi:MAG: TetR/AcrR family transcriptional regulator [Phycisphaerae bacterium]
MAKGRPRQFDEEEALDAALLLFWRRGYEGTSLAALTEAMGINMPSLYAAFGNKEALFRRVLERYLHGPASYLSKALAEPSARGAAETLFRGAINMTMDQRHPDGCLLVHGALVSGPGTEGVRKELAAWRGKAQGAVQQRFERAVAEGDLPAGTDAGKLAGYITTMVWGLSVQAAGGATRRQLEDAAAFAMRAWPE